MMKQKRLLLVVGSGASIPFGLPSVDDLGSKLAMNMQRRFPLRDDPSTNLYSHVNGLIQEHWNKYAGPFSRKRLSFEDVIYALNIASTAYPAGVLTAPYGALVAPRPLPDFNFIGQTPLSVDGHQLANLATMCVDEVFDIVRKSSGAVTGETENVPELARFIDELRTHFAVSVVTTNYDNLFYRYMSDLETGFDKVTQQFDPSLLLNRTKWECFIHLHGSIHFGMKLVEGTPLSTIVWDDCASGTTSRSFGRASYQTPEGVPFPASSIIAGYGKRSQLLRTPFKTYFSEFERLVSGCDALLICGCGFNDDHVNAIFNGFRDARRRKVVVIGKADEHILTAGAYNEGSADFAVKSLDVFETQARSMRWLGYWLPHNLKELVSKREFERSNDAATPLALWYTGAVEAFEEPRRIIGELQ